jgi:hypothetical protein
VSIELYAEFLDFGSREEARIQMLMNVAALEGARLMKLAEGSVAAQLLVIQQLQRALEIAEAAEARKQKVGVACNG